MSDNNRDLKLNESELANIAGGKTQAKEQKMLVACRYCHKNFEVNIRKSFAFCPECRRRNDFAG